MDQAGLGRITDTTEIKGILAEGVSSFGEHHRIDKELCCTNLMLMASHLLEQAQQITTQGKYAFTVSGLNIAGSILYPSLDSVLDRCLEERWGMHIKRDGDENSFKREQMLPKNGLMDHRDKGFYNYRVTWDPANPHVSRKPDAPFALIQPEDVAFGMARTIGRPLGTCTDVTIKTGEASLTALSLFLVRIPYLNRLLNGAFIERELEEVTLQVDLSERELRFLLNAIYCTRFNLPEQNQPQDAPTAQELVSILLVADSWLSEELMLAAWTGLEEKLSVDNACEVMNQLLPIVTSITEESQQINVAPIDRNYHKVKLHIRESCRYFLVQHPEVLKFDEQTSINELVTVYLLGRSLRIQAIRETSCRYLLDLIKDKASAERVFAGVLVHVLRETPPDNDLCKVLDSASQYLDITVTDAVLLAGNLLISKGESQVFAEEKPLSWNALKGGTLKGLADGQMDEDLPLALQEMCSLLRIGALSSSPAIVSWTSAHLQKKVALDENFLPVGLAAVAVRDTNSSLFLACQTMVRQAEQDGPPIGKWTLAEAMQGLDLLASLEHDEYMQHGQRHLAHLIGQDTSDDYASFLTVLDKAEQQRSHSLRSVLKALMKQDGYAEALEEKAAGLYERFKEFLAGSLKWKRPRTGSLADSISL